MDFDIEINFTKEEIELIDKIIYTAFPEDIDEITLNNLREMLILFVRLFMLKDEEFNVISAEIINQLERDYNSSEGKLALIQTMNINGLKKEDMKESYTQIINMIINNFEINESKQNFLKSFFNIISNAIEESSAVSNRIINIPIEKIHTDAKLPEYAHLTDSGMDIYAIEDITINPGETVLVPTGIKVAIPKNYELQVRPKSGRSLKSKLRIANTPGTIDAGYRDEIGIIVDNIDSAIRAVDVDYNSLGYPVIKSIEFGRPYTIEKGEKIAQLVLCEVPKIAWTEVEHVNEIEGDRGGGFGSTGLK